LKDWDAASADDIIGTNFINFSTLTDMNWGNPRWLCFYGAPLDVSDAGILPKNVKASKITL